MRKWPSTASSLSARPAGPQARLNAVDQLASEPQLVDHYYLPAAPAEFLGCLHRTDDARLAYQEARLLADNPAEQDFLTRRLSELDA